MEKDEDFSIFLSSFLNKVEVMIMSRYRYRPVAVAALP
jgi:hypothetical protein